MIALIDGDVVNYRVGFTTDGEEEWIARARVDEMLDGILVETNAEEFEVFLSDSKESNFRFAIYPPYKANRATMVRPRHYEAIKEYLITKWGAKIALGMEADDLLGIKQKPQVFEIQPDGGWGTSTPTVICSIDKDLLQIPGQHYNFVKKEWQEVTEWEGIKWFYSQLLIGDVSDNVKGCTGIGPVKAGKAINSVSEEAGECGLFRAVYDLYKKQEKGKTEEEILAHILQIGRVLKIRQKQEETLWDFPESIPTQTLKSSSTQLTVAVNTPSTEPTILETENGLSQLGHSKDSISKAVLPA